MTWAILPPIAVLTASTAAGAAWLSKRSWRLMQDPQKLISKIQSGQLDGVEYFVTRGEDLLAGDSDFWVRSNGFSGLLRRRHNAICLLRLCQIISETANLQPSDLTYMSQRVILMNFLVCCAIAEQCLRVFVRDLPHLCARAATQLYWDMERRTFTLAREFREYDPDLCDQLTAIL